MKKIVSLVCFTLLFNVFYFSQDTTWVQTFTFDSIATRRAEFQFPQELNSKSFEKVLMYYRLKCSPLTPWDQYNCGEWDYLTYTNIYKHLGLFDSLEVFGNQFTSNFNTPNSIAFDIVPFTRKDTYVREEKNRSNPNLTTFTINTANTNSKFPFNTNKQGGRFQYLISASELTNAGIVAGDIQSIRLFVNSFLTNGELKYPRISIKSTALAELVNFENAGFTEVYNASHWANGSQSELQIGANDFLFYQSFTWNGTDNLIMEFYFENSEDNANFLLFDSENISSNTALGFDANNGSMQFNGANKSMTQLSDFTMGNEMTIAFWAKGTGSAGTNTSILEMYDTLNNRIVNVHFPWSDNSMYFDAGLGSGTDRINKLMTASEIDNNWNHWALVKNASTGSMKIYKNGNVWHSGTGKTIPIGYVHRMILGVNKDLDYFWKGKLDEFQVYNAALSQADIQTWMKKKVTNTHPNWSNLLVYYDFDDKIYAEDKSANDNHLMPSEYGMLVNDEFPKVEVMQLTKRPVIGFGQGIVSGNMVNTEHPFHKLKEAQVIFEYTSVNRHFEIANARVGQVSASEITYDLQGVLVSENPFIGVNTMVNDSISYFTEPVERLETVEIGRYITPYGINFDLGANGFNYIYDVSDYQQLLKNLVDLSAHNTQELIDLKFAFIEGIPARDVHNRQAIWSDTKSFLYSALDNNTELPSVDVQLADSSSNFKIKTRFTGHGHNGSVNCCEWDSKDHQILVNGTPRFYWEIWQESECGTNPLVSQGGTWPYAREGWCPGDMVKEYDHELTPYVNGGETVSLDYDIENVPANDPSQGNGNYVIAMDLISYSAPNFQNDAAIIDVLNPNNYEYFRKYNPTCAYPRVILQNNGNLPLTSCVIRIYVEAANYIDFPWTGNLAFLQKEVVEIPVTDISWWQNPTGMHTFHAEIVEIQGGAGLDEYAFNNVKETKFAAPEIVQGPFYVWLTTNNKASENKYKLMKDDGEVIFQRLNMQNTTTYRDTFYLEPGCYSIILEDSDDDGLSFWYSAIPTSQGGEGETAGAFRLRNVGGGVFETFPGDFGSYHRFNFSIGLESLNANEKSMNDNLFLYPNPANKECFIDLGNLNVSNVELQLQDLSGRILMKENIQVKNNVASTTLDVSNLPKGLYLIKVFTGEFQYVKQLVLN